MFFRRSSPPRRRRAALRPGAAGPLPPHGDVADLGLLYDRYLPEAFAVCRRYLAPPDEDAQDAVMQLFEHLVKVLRTHAPDNFPAWLHTTARNHCLMQLRARKRAGPSAGPLVLSFPDAADVELAAARHLPDEAAGGRRCRRHRNSPAKHGSGPGPAARRPSAAASNYFTSKRKATAKSPPKPASN